MNAPLHALQQRFQQQVQNGDPQHTEPGEVSGHMEIYTKAYGARMRQALADNFPVLQRALGDEGFDALACAYCAARPSTHRSLRWLGDGLVEFMAANPAHLPHPALLDLARMDWAMRAAFDAADADCLQLQDLAALPAADWPALTLRTVPSLRLLQLQWGVEALWHTLHADSNAQTCEPELAPHAMLVWRQQLECRWRSVDASEQGALLLLQHQSSFADVCEGLQRAGATAPAPKAVGLLKTWVSEGLLARH